jgi:vitamin B12 transporter
MQTKQSKSTLRIGFLCLMALAFSQLTLAQNQSFNLDSIVISSSRMDLSPGQMDHQIAVISAEQLKNYPVNSVDELLRYVSGVEVLSRSVFGAQADISVRGGTFNQVLVLLDGVRINDPLTGHFNAYFPVALAEIQRIEIIKGASSGVYGSDAVGGIINLITKTFAKTHGHSSLAAELEAWYGENQLMRVNGGGLYERKKWAIGGGLSTSQSEGHLAPGDSIRNYFNLATYSLSGNYSPNEKLSLSWRSALDVRDFNARFFYTRSNLDQSVEQVSRQFNLGSLKYRHNLDHQTVLNFGAQTTRDSFLFNPSFAANVHQTRHTDLNLYHLMNLGTQTRLTFGTHYLSRRIESNDRGNHQNGSFGVYGLINQQIGYRFHLNGGLRLDHDPAFAWVASPQVGFNWQAIANLSLRGFVGRSIRAADYTERYVSNNLPAPLSAGRNLGNPDLTAEKAWNYELGADLELIPDLTLNTTLFYRQGKDLVDFVLTPGYEIDNAPNASDSAEYFYARNFSRLNTRGAEFALNHQQQFRHSDLRLTAGVMLLAFENPDGGISKYIANNAGLLTNFSLRYHHRLFSLSMNGIYKNRSSEEAEAINRELKKSYFVVNGRADLHPFAFPLSFSVMASNLFNADYADILGASLPGRWVQGGISWRLGK